MAIIFSLLSKYDTQKCEEHKISLFPEYIDLEFEFDLIEDKGITMLKAS